MNHKFKLIVIGVLGLIVVVTAFVFLKNFNKSKTPVNDVNSVPAKEVEFVVVRVLPTGFSPKEVSIKKGMIVRFTNPLDKKVAIKWEDDKQYTNAAVYKDHDIATEVFDKAGTFNFNDGDSPHQGSVIVE